MTKKKFKFNLKISLDAPVTTFFALFSLILFTVDTIFLKGKLSLGIFSSPTSASGSLPFSVSSATSYLRLILYIFGAASWTSLLVNLLFVLLLGPAMEERYGSVVIGIMMIVSALFSGVLNACFCTVSLQGCLPLVFMMIFLNSFMSFSKKKVPLSFVMIFIFFIAYELIEKSPSQLVGIIICIAGGLCGSLFAFLTSPKARAAKKSEVEKEKSEKSEKSEKTSQEDARKAYLEELDKQSPRNKNSKKNDDDETTVVGTLKF